VKGILADRTSRKNLAAYYALTFRVFRNTWAVVMPGSVATVIMKLPMPLLTGYVIDAIVRGGKGDFLNMICGGLILLTILYLAIGYLIDYLGFRINRSIAIRYKLRVLRQIQALPLDYAASRETGYLMSRVSQDPNQLTGLISQLMVIFTNLITAIVGVTTMFLIDARLAALSITIIPFFAASYLVFQSKIRILDGQEKEQGAIVSRGLKEAIAAVPVAKLFSLQAMVSLRFLRSVREELRISIRSFNYEYAVLAGTSLFAAMGPLVVVWFGGRQVMAGRLTIGQLVSFSSLLSFLYGPTRTIMTSNVGFLRALVSLGRVCDILDRKKETALFSCGQWGQPNGFSIEYRGVSFSYSDKVSTLRNIDLSIADREIVALVGPTGAGKSTLISVLPLFRTPNTGTVLIGGCDIRTIPLRDLRRSIGLLSQTPFLFSASVYENIAIGRHGATRGDVIRAAELANAAGFISKLDGGFDAQVGEDGQFLSGGQKQLICLARVILKDSPILLLDEPTSAVDTVTEALMQESIASFIRGRTTIIVSHRLSTVLNVDRVVVLENGTIADEGSHRDLRSRNSYYGNMAGRYFHEVKA
jgi:subfamily B ATP-binding cassette protein MsbA